MGLKYKGTHAYLTILKGTHMPSTERMSNDKIDALIIEGASSNSRVCAGMRTAKSRSILGSDKG